VGRFIEIPENVVNPELVLILFIDGETIFKYTIKKVIYNYLNEGGKPYLNVLYI